MKQNMKKILGSLLAVVTLLALAACSSSASNPPPTSPASPPPAGSAKPELDFPKQDINIVVPYAAGGNTDLMARALATKMSELAGVNVVIQNVEGGGGATGTAQAVSSKPDGYTLALPASSAYILNSQVNDVGFTYDTTTPICIISEANFGIAVAADSPYQTLQDLIDAAAAAPNSITYATPGANSAGHLLVAAIGQAENIEWNHSPNTSAPAAIAELIGGHIDAYCSNLSVFKTALESGDIRLLCVTGQEREAKYPDTPCVYELGYEFPASVYFSLVGPSGMDPAVAGYLSDLVGKAMDDATVQDAFANLDQPMSFVPYDTFITRVVDDHNFYNSMLKDMGIIN